MRKDVILWQLAEFKAKSRLEAGECQFHFRNAVIYMGIVPRMLPAVKRHLESICGSIGTNLRMRGLTFVFQGTASKRAGICVTIPR